MSRYGQIFLAISIFAFLLLIICRVALGGWVNYLFFPLAFFMVSFFAALVVDIKFYIQFLQLKTTKKGMNMGVIILLVFLLFGAVNFLSVLKDKSWDLSSNQLNTLSQETEALLKNIDQPIKVTTYYRGAEDQVIKLAVKQLIDRYRSKNRFLKSYFVNSYSDRLKAEKQLQKFSSQGEMISIVSMGERQIKVEYPMNEKNFTTALIRATRKSKKTIYFMKGHGEAALDSKEPAGLLDLKNSLEAMAFDVKELNFVMTKVTIPQDASALALVGPRLKLFPNEVVALTNYLKQGGRLLVAADPGVNHGVEQLLSYMGVLFRNNYIIGEVAEKLGRSASSALGLRFDQESLISKPLGVMGAPYAIFELASELNHVETSPDSDYNYRPLVYSAQESFTVKELQVEVKAGVRQEKVIALEVTKKNNSNFGLVVFGDSDFLTNKDIVHGVNRRLGLNALAYLAKEPDLIQVPEKKLKGTVLIMTGRLQNTVILAGVLFPLFLLMMSGFVYFKRKSA